MSESNIILSFITLPKELIYKIAAEDAGVYDRILRLCRATSSLFPLSTRLDFMIGFGVRVGFSSMDKNESAACVWTWNAKLHDIFGPAITWGDGDVDHYCRGELHRDDGKPARIYRKRVVWYHHGTCHRSTTAPSGTGNIWLAGAAHIATGDVCTIIIRVVNGIHVDEQQHTHADDIEAAQAEIDYWRALE